MKYKQSNTGVWILDVAICISFYDCIVSVWNLPLDFGQFSKAIDYLFCLDDKKKLTKKHLCFNFPLYFGLYFWTNSVNELVFICHNEKKFYCIKSIPLWRQPVSQPVTWVPRLQLTHTQSQTFSIFYHVTSHDIFQPTNAESSIKLLHSWWCWLTSEWGETQKPNMPQIWNPLLFYSSVLRLKLYLPR